MAAPDERENPQPPSDAGPVAGRIEVTKSEVARAIDGYMEYKGDRLRGTSARGYRGLLTAAARELGWTRLSDIGADAVEAWAIEKRRPNPKTNRPAWQAKTSNKNLGILQDFTRWVGKQARRKGGAFADPLADLESVPDRDRKQRGRAATTAEARRLIAWTCAREQTDRRADGYRALMRACLFMQGLRPGEPEVIRWRNLLLDESVPIIHWTPDVQKNHREEATAINPELVPLLLEHRAQMLRRADETGGVEVRVDRRFGRQGLRPFDPRVPDAFVFPKTSSPCQWTKDVKSSGIPAVDAMGRRFEGRAARRWFATTAREAGADDMLVRSIMRHKQDVPERYFDVKPAMQVKVFLVLPKLWPGNYLASAEKADSTGAGSDFSTNPLTPGVKYPKVVHLVSASQDQSGSPNSEVLTRPEPTAEKPGSCGCGTRGTIDARGPTPRVPQVESRALNQEIALLGLEIPDSTSTRNAIADLLDAVSRLLREPGSVHERQANRTA